MSLAEWGWDDRWASAVAADPRAASVARVTGQERDRWDLVTSDGARPGRLASARAAGPRPVTGDWVFAAPGPLPADPWSISGVVLPRRSSFSRGAAGGGTAEQVLAANVDRVWIVHGLDVSPNRRRLERYLAVAWESGAVPEVVLTKADVAADLAEATAIVAEVAIGATVWTVSSATGAGMPELLASLRPGRTIALLGPSGVGKSTLVNALADTDLAATGAVRERDRKGRHTTTSRELYRIRGGALLLDTPGMRELRVWDLDEGLAGAFADIDALARDCRFRDCRHDQEPGCAVRRAVADGRLDPGRLASFAKLRAEAEWMARREDPLARAAEVARTKAAMKSLKHHPKFRRRP